MNIQVILRFGKIYSNSKKNKQTLQDISQVISIVNSINNLMSDEAKVKMLQIPLYVLKNHVELKGDSSDFKKLQPYFTANSKQKWKDVYDTGTFNLNTVADQLEDFINVKNFSAFGARNAEVVLRDATTERGDFKDCGIIYAMLMEEAFKL